MVYLVDAQAKELDDFRKFVGLRALPGDANTVENDDQTEFTATSPATSEYYSPLDEVRQSVANVNQESGLFKDDISAPANSDGHGFVNPCGFTGTGHRGTGTGSYISTLHKPVPSHGVGGSDGGFDHISNRF